VPLATSPAQWCVSSSRWGRIVTIRLPAGTGRLPLFSHVARVVREFVMSKAASPARSGPDRRSCRTAFSSGFLTRPASLPERAERVCRCSRTAIRWRLILLFLSRSRPPSTRRKPAFRSPELPPADAIARAAANSRCRPWTATVSRQRRIRCGLRPPACACR